jgi:methanogenic corrinoid protein MtbC1
MIGGAPITLRFADEIGADGFSRDAAGAAVIAKGLLAKVAVTS